MAYSKEKHAEDMRRYRLKVGEEKWKEMQRAASARYRERHHVELLTKGKEWRERPENKDKIREAGKRWYAEHREEALAKDKEQYAAGRLIYQRQRVARYLREYGMTLEDYDRLLTLQANKCPLDGEEFGVGAMRPVVDHAHDTKLVRGVLHDRCNRAIGLAELQPLFQSDVIKAYLANPPARRMVEA